MKDLSLRITEIFYSLQGEADTAGWPTVFIRLTGCPLRCGYCDTEYAFQGGEQMTIDEIVAQVSQYKTKYVCVTGGEPLAQKACFPLLARLCDEGYLVSLETSGAMDIAPVDNRVSIVMDIKTPASGEHEKNRLQNLDRLGTQDMLKFVICDEADYVWAREFINSHTIKEGVQVLFSPAYETMSPTTLAEWILRDSLPVRLQIQLHKLLWGNEKGR